MSVVVLLCGAASAQEEVWLELYEPAPGAVENGAIPLVEFKGSAGVGDAVYHDVVIVLDLSGSTAYASGVDVDGDGKVGRVRMRARDAWRSFNPRRLSTDPDDTVLAAERVATRRLVELLDRERTRVGIVSFHASARVESSLTSSATKLTSALDRLDGSFGSGATNLAEGTRVALQVLKAAPERTARVRRSILILSDGYPTTPPPEERAVEESLRAAREAAALDVRIFSFTLGLPDHSNPNDVFGQMARITGGRLQRVRSPGEIVHRLREVQLTELARVTIENLTTGSASRSLRIFPDGSFDAYIRLAPGENRVRLRAESSRGTSRELERSVYYERRTPTTLEEAEAVSVELERLRRKLRDRTVETQMLREIERERAERDGERELEIEVEPAREQR
ncbi:MAG: vWA domain-containing protein [Myxococcota bacterium]